MRFCSACFLVSGLRDATRRVGRSAILKMKEVQAIKDSMRSDAFLFHHVTISNIYGLSDTPSASDARTSNIRRNGTEQLGARCSAIMYWLIYRLMKSCQTRSAYYWSISYLRQAEQGVKDWALTTVFAGRSLVQNENRIKCVSEYRRTP